VDKRFNQIQQFIIQLASGNFEYKVTPSESLDEIDALIVGINMLGEELKVSQEKHVALFEHAGDAILIFSTASNKFVDSNEMATTMLGFSAEDIRLLSIIDLFPKEEKTRIESKVTYLKSVIQTKFDKQIETKAGNLKDVSFLSKRLPYGDDQYFQISLRDITEAKQISNHLVKKNAELIQAQKEIGELSKFPSENPNPILRFNEKFELLYNNEASTINFLSDFKIKENKLNDRVLKDYLKEAKANGGSETIIETRNNRHYSLTYVYVQEFNYINIYGTDITKRIQTEEENMKLSFVAKNTNNGILMLNKNREITWANTAFLERSGYSFSEIIGQNSTHYLLDETNDSFVDKVRIAMDRQEKVSGELVRRSKKGGKYWVDLNIQPLFDSANNLTGFMFVEFDITDSIINKQTIQNLNMNLENLVEQKTKKLRSNELKLEKSLIKEKERTIALKRSEKKLKKSLIKEKELGQLKASFVTVASHQFRTPLAVIQSNTELLEMLNNIGKKQKPEKYAKVTNRITSAISTMTDLMDDVLTLGKLTSGKVLYSPQYLDLVIFCKKLAEEYDSVQIDGRSINFVTEGEPYKVYLDAKLLEHTLSNLISNAFKYSKGKENPELSIHFKSKELTLSVKDYGLGIPKDQHLHLFEPFFRADNATDIQGTGLGLSIAKEYVEVNKGTISAKSILGKGSCFKIIFKKDKL